MSSNANDDADITTERQHLLSKSEVQPTTMEISMVLKLKCFIYAMLLIALGFVTTIVETQDFLEDVEKTDTSDRAARTRRIIKWICFGIKCAYLLPAIAGLLYLQRWAIVQGKLPLVALQVCDHGSQSDLLQQKAGVLLLKSVNRYVYLPRRLNSSPSMLIILTSLLFALFSCLSIIFEMACGVIASIKSAEFLPDVFGCMILLIFVITQARFSILYGRVSFQWKLRVACLVFAHVIATNISAWFFGVGVELREIISNETAHGEFAGSYCTMFPIIRSLYPFLTEYYVMSALIVFGFSANVGKLGVAIKEAAAGGIRISTESIRDLLTKSGSPRTGHTWRAERSMMRRYSSRISVGVGLLLITLAAAIFLRSQNKDKMYSQVAFYCILILLYSSGMACNCLLLGAISTSRTGLHKFSSIHSTDRILLWLGALAITVNNIYTIGMSVAQILREYNVSYKLPELILSAVCSGINIGHSMLQVFTLECTLLCKLSSGKSHYGQAMLTVLMIVNSAQWLVNTICFSFFFPKNQLNDARVLSLLTVPLQVFFRFHSIACMHDFKKHCNNLHAAHSADNRSEQVGEQAVERLNEEPIDFPDDS